MRIRQVYIGVLAFMVVAGWSASGWASPRPIDSCRTIEADSRSSFVLVRNLFGKANEDCLTIIKSDMNIDLNGFTIYGKGSGIGIVASAAIQGVTIRNGTVRGFATGISLSGYGNVVENVQIAYNTDTGLFLGASGVARQLVVQKNAQMGVVLSTACSITDSMIRANGNSPDSIGLSAGPGSTVKCNTLWANVGTGLRASLGSSVMQNTVLDTNGDGISVTCPANVLQNTTIDNLGTNLVIAGTSCNVVNNVQ